MKHGKRPNRTEMGILRDWHLNPDDWLVVKHTPEIMDIVYRYSDKTMRRINLK